MIDKIWFSNLNLSYLVKREILRKINVDKLYDTYCIQKKSLEFLKKYDVKLKDFEILSKSKKDLEYMKKFNIKIVFFSDDVYPKQLFDLNEFPLYLYCIGDLKMLSSYSNTIAIIGSRNCSHYGEKVAKEFSKKLAEHGIVVVSGMAKGIDGICQKVCIENGGKSIGVIRSGIDMFYPKENIDLAKTMVKTNNLILSEYPLGTPPYKYNFPWRNRIISGLARNLLVIEARKKSGTLITVNYALDMGRDVFAIPNNIYMENSNATNLLIQEGAKLVSCFQDILSEYIF